MKKIVIFNILFFISSLVFAQSWIDLMQEPNQNFYQTQDAFNNFWEGKSIEKGKGWKQFKRWENFMEPRVYPDGNFRSNILYEEHLNLQSSNNEYRMLPPNVWTQVGPSDVPLQSNGSKRGIGRLNSIVFHPTDSNTIYVGAPAGGFWKSSNGGQTWSTSSDFLNNLGVSDIAIHPQNPDTLFIITGDRDGGDTYSYGVMKSYNGGNSWSTTGLSFNITSSYRGNRIMFDPIDPNIIIVATSNGIFRSSDGGNIFTNTFSSVNLVSLEFHPTNSNIIYAGSKGNTTVYKSSDNGVTWAVSGTGLPSTNDVVRCCIAVTNDNPNVIYALFGDNSNGFYGLYKSSDEGLTWNSQSNSPNLLGWSTNGSDNGGQAWYDLALTVSHTDENKVFVGGVNCWKSNDSGVNWDLNTHWYGGGGASYMHADEHMLQYNPIDNKVYSANDGGLYFSSDDGLSWQDISDGLQITQFYSLGVSQTVQDLVITGSQDNGTFLKNSNSWDAVIGGDGMECIIDHSNSDVMYGAIYYGDIRKSTNGGNSFSSIAPVNNGAWETPYEMDENNSQIIYAGYKELYKTIDGGSSWNIITNNETNGGTINEIALSSSNSNIIFFSDGSNLFKTDNAGNSWQNISSSLPNKSITYIIVSPYNENRVWVTFSGYTNQEKVYHSDDGGNSWQNISGTLPNVPANCIELDYNDSLETVYLGTDLGVFKKDSTLSDWNLFNNNSLPNVIVNELEIQYQSNKLVAATYGRGLWNIDLQITSPPSADFTLSDSVFCNIPSTVSFTNTSYYSNSYLWDFGDGSSSISTNPTHTYSSYGSFTVSLIASGPLGNDTIVYSSIININTSNSCITTLPSSGSGVTQTNCNGTLYDVGGPNSNYYDNNNSWITISPPGSNQIQLIFLDFDIEAPSSQSNCNWDYLEIFDGPDSSYQSLGQFCNSLTGSPDTIISSTGSLTIYLHADQSVNGRGFEAVWSCTYPSLPPQALFTSDDTLSCDGNINFIDLSTNGPSSWFWNFGDGTFSTLQNPSHSYSAGGVYDVSLLTTNQYGVDSIILNNYINIFILDSLIISGDQACYGDTFNLSAFSNNYTGSINWYSDSNCLNYVNSGNYLNLLNNLSFSGTSNYYVRNELSFPSIFGGPSDNSFGGGAFYQGNKHLIFDNYKSSKLVSVLVYANSDGFRTIELRNSSNLVIADTNIFIPYSPQGLRIYLNFLLPVENNLQLGVNGVNSDLYRNDVNAIFPYDVSNILSITGTNAPNGYYYFFYDWEIKKSTCSSPIQNVEINNLSPSDSSILVNEFYLCVDSFPIILWDTISVNSPGIYNDTLKTSFGCIETINIYNVALSSIFYQNINLCFGETLSIGNNIYSNSGVFSDTLYSDFCDSIIVTTLNFSPPYTSIFQNFNLCFGDTLFVGNNYYLLPGIYTDIIVSQSGCDSILITSELNFNSFLINNNLQIICYGESYNIGANSYIASGVYSDSLISIFGCDSIVITDLLVLPALYNNQIFTICDEDSIHGITVGTNTYYNSGIYYDTLSSSIFCDSILITTINVDVGSDSVFYQNINLCFGETFSIGNNIYSNSGVFSDTLNSGFCDSIIVTSLNFSPPYTSIFQNFNLCFGDTLFVGNNYYLSSGIYTDVIVSESGCDSIVITSELNFNSFLLHNNPQLICSGESYNIGTSSYSTPGIYSDSLTSISGCDSIVITNLLVLPTLYNNQTFTLCNQDSINGITVGSNIYYSSGIYYDTLYSSMLCDSVIIITINQSNPSAEFNLINGELVGNVLQGSPPFLYEFFGPNGLLFNSYNLNGDSVSITPNEAGDYYFVCTDDLSCTDTNFYFNFLSTINQQNSFLLNIFPNPTSDIININLFSSISQKIKLNIKSIVGQQIFHKELNDFIGEFSLALDLQKYPKGIYIFSIENNNIFQNYKIILK